MNNTNAHISIVSRLFGTIKKYNSGYYDYVNAFRSGEYNFGIKCLCCRMVFWSIMLFLILYPVIDLFRIFLSLIPICMVSFDILFSIVSIWEHKCEKRIDKI